MSYYNYLSGQIIDTAILIHRKMGPGLFESVYHTIMLYELRKKGLKVESEVPIPVVWDEVRMDVGFKADLIVDDLIIVELKSIETLAPVHHKQLLTYLKVTDKRLGLFLNFGAEVLKDGLARVVNGL